MSPKTCTSPPTVNRNNQGLNYIEVIPSPFVEEEKEKDQASLRVMTRAQTNKRGDNFKPSATLTTNKRSRKRGPRKSRSRAGEKSRSGSKPRPEGKEEIKQTPEKMNKEQEEHASTSSSYSHKGGFVLIDKKYLSIFYASRQLNSAKKNYTTTKSEGLAMIYVVKKFRQALLISKPFCFLC